MRCLQGGEVVHGLHRQDSAVGYVIGEEESWTTLLTASGNVVIQRSSDIESGRVSALERTSSLASHVERPSLRLRMPSVDRCRVLGSPPCTCDLGMRMSSSIHSED